MRVRFFRKVGRLLFAHASPGDVALMALGTLSAITAGIGYLAFDFLMWSTIGAAMGSTPSSIGHTLVDMGYFMVMMAMALLTALTVSEWLFRLAAHRRAARMRVALAASLFSRDIEWYESEPESVHESYLFFRDSVQTVQAGIGPGIQQFVFFVSICIGGFIISFVYTCQLTLVLLGTMPVIVVGMAVVARSTVKAADLDQATFSSAAKSAMKTLRGIKTVFSFQQEEAEYSKFRSLLLQSRSVILRTALFTGLGHMAAQGMAVVDMGVGLWFMATLTQDGTADPVLDGSTLVWVLTTMIYGGLALGYSTEGLTAMATSAELIGKMEKSLIPSGKSSCEKSAYLDTDIVNLMSFESLEFNYSAFSAAADAPSSGRTGTVCGGQRVAFVGPRSCNTGVVASVLARFSDRPDGGLVKVNGVDISDVPIASLRGMMGYVGQEPGIFNTSIRQNLTIGLPHDSIPSDPEICHALARVGLGKFVDCLPLKLDTPLRRGEFPPMTVAQERQIGIARALLRHPSLLVVEGVADGLPPEDERIVNLAVQAAAAADPTLTIICVTDEYRNMHLFDNIFVLDANGTIVESGSHDTLISAAGTYFNLLKQNDPELLLHSTASGMEQPAVPSTMPHVSEDVSPLSRVSIRRETGIVHRRLALVTNEKFSWRRVIGFSRDYWYISLPIGILASVLCGVIPPLVICTLSQLTEEFDTPSVLDSSAAYIYSLLGLGAAMALGCLAREIAYGRVTEGTIRAFRLSSLHHILNQPIDLYEAGNSPECVMSSLWSKCYSAGYLACVVINSVVECAAWCFVAITIGFVASWRIASVSVSSMVVMTLAYYMFARCLPPDGKVPDAVDVVGDALSSVRVIKSVRGESEIVSLFASTLSVENSAIVWNSFVLSLFSSLPFSICPVLTSFGFWYSGVIYASTPEVSLPGIIQATYAVGDAGELAMYVISWLPDFKKFEQEAMQVFDLLDNDSSFDRGEAELYSPIKSVSLHKVSFAYSSSLKNPVLTDITLEANRGELIGIIGPFKCGKSSLMNLIQRFYDPQYGRVNVNGCPVATFTIHSLRRVQAFVPQQPVLIDGTLRDNVLYGSHPGHSQHWESVCRLCCIDFVDNWDVPVSSKHPLTQCQMQRICIARALIRNPDILLIDDAFAVMGTGVADTVRANIEASRAGRITIVATTSPRVVQHADRIYVLDCGKIVQTGSHQDLVETGNGIYFKMN